MRAGRREHARLEDEVRRELDLDHKMDPDEVNRAVQETLCRRHECRLPQLPDALVAARAGRGTAFGPDDVVDYVARPPSRGAPPLPPVLAVRGRYDVVTAACGAGWRGVCTGATGGTAYRE